MIENPELKNSNFFGDDSSDDDIFEVARVLSSQSSQQSEENSFEIEQETENSLEDFNDFLAQMKKEINIEE